MSEEIRYYRGLHKVKVVTQSDGYWIIEALEEFEDTLNGEVVTVKVGEKRIIPPQSANKQKISSSPVKENKPQPKLKKKNKRKVAKKRQSKK